MGEGAKLVLLINCLRVISYSLSHGEGWGEAPYRMNKIELETRIIAGPCSAETREQMLQTAAGLQAIGIGTLRAGLWKPRSRCGTFEGVGERGLPWMQEIQQTFGMQVMTEVALPSHIEAALNAGLDMFWIGARTTVNPFMMHELAEALRGVDIPVWVKNPVSPDLELWIGGIERLQHAGVKRIGAIHRGFCLVDNAPYRNSPLWDQMEALRHRLPGIPIYCDPSHIAGKRELLLEICRKALSLQVDGLFIESHCCPQNALSDAAQQLTPDALSEMLGLMKE